MRRVPFQRRSDDCGICVVAGIAKVTYRQAQQAIFGTKEPHHYWTSSCDLATALKRLGVRCDVRARPLGQRSFQELDHDAILVCDKSPSGWWHWCLWLVDQRRFIDPAQPPKKHRRCSAYLKIYR